MKYEELLSKLNIKGEILATIDVDKIQNKVSGELHMQAFNRHRRAIVTFISPNKFLYSRDRVRIKIEKKYGYPYSWTLYATEEEIEAATPVQAEDVELII